LAFIDKNAVLYIYLFTAIVDAQFAKKQFALLCNQLININQSHFL